MGTEAAWIPAVIAAVGSAAQGYEQYQTGKSQDEAAAQGIMQQAADQRKADSRVSQEVRKLEGSTPEDSQRQATDAFMDQLKRTRQQSYGADQVGAVSDQYTADTARAKTGVDQYGVNRAGVMARINAPGLQRTQENIGRARLGSDLGQIARQSQADAFLSQLRQRSIQANPWMMAGGDVLKGVAGGMAANAGSGTLDDATATMDNGSVIRVPAPKPTYSKWGMN